MSQLQRARKTEDKVIRREKILKASRQLFEDLGLDAITMDLIAKKSELAKGTLYLYFKTKEEVFLDLQREDLFQWMRILTHQFERFQGPMTAQQFAQVITSYTEHQNSFLRLLTLLHPVLESNVPPEKAKQFKLEVKTEMTALAMAISKKLDGLTPHKSFVLVFRIYTLIVGLCQTANPNAAMTKILNDPELGVFRIDFGSELKESLIWMINGMGQTASAVQESKFDFHSNY